MPVPIYIVLGFSTQLILGLLALKKRKENNDLFLAYIYAAVLTDIVGTGIALSNIYLDALITNRWLYDIYTPIELLLLGSVAIKGIGSFKRTFGVLIGLGAIGISFLLINGYSNYATMFESAILFTLGATLFGLKMRDIINRTHEMSNKYILIGAGMTFYFGINTVGFFLMYGEVHNLVHSITNILQNIAYIGALYERD